MLFRFRSETHFGFCSLLFFVSWFEIMVVRCKKEIMKRLEFSGDGICAFIKEHRSSLT